MIEERHTVEENLNSISESTVTNYKNMADKRICETIATQVSPTLGISNNNYGPWNNMHCVQCCVSQVQDGRYVTVYSDVCLRYRVGEMLLCTVLCV